MAIGKLMITLGILVISIQLSSAILCLCKWTNKVNTFCCLGLHKCCPTPPPQLPPPPQYHVHNEYYGGYAQYPAPNSYSAGAAPAAPSAYMAAPAAPSPPKPQYDGQSQHMGMVYNPPASAPGHYAPSDHKGESPPMAAPVAPSVYTAAPAAPSLPKPQYAGQSQHMGMVYNPAANAPGHYAPSNDHKGDDDYYKYLYGSGHK